jgi:nitrite reductase/ring-hydroxylating ferredoxin subunit
LKLVGRVPLACIREGELVRVPYPPWHVLVTMVRGAPVAIEDSCNHAGASLADGTREGDRVACPMHGYVFELATGELVAPVGLCDSQRRFTVIVEGDDAIVFDPFEVKIVG